MYVVVLLPTCACIVIIKTVRKYNNVTYYCLLNKDVLCFIINERESRLKQN